MARLRILLVQPRYNYVRNFAEAPSGALLILGTLAENAGHEVKIRHLDIDKEPITVELEEFKPDILGITVNTLQVKSARITARQARAVSRDIKIVVGGPHAAFWDGEADEVVIGEGENRWLEILGENTWVKRLDDIPQLNYGLVNPDKFCGHPPAWVKPAMVVMASRGCPYNCVFCNTPVYWGKKVRYRSPELVVEEIEYLHKKHGVKEVSFQDDTFNLNHEWAMEIFEGLTRKGLNREVLLRITSRVSEKLVTREFLDFARRAGVWQIFYGIESGSQYMLDRMKKGITVEEIKRAIRMTKEAGIFAYCSFVVGLPGETWETLKETERLINEIRPSSFNWAYGCPFPNTEFDKEVTSKGQKLEIDYEEYGYGKVIARTDALSFEDLASFKGFSINGGEKVKSWADFYRECCENERLLIGNIKHHVPFIIEVGRWCKPGHKVLEIGSGTGVMGWPIAQADVKILSIDNDPEIIEMARKNAKLVGADIEYRAGDIRELKFDDNSFDVVYTEGLLEHFSDKEIRVLIKDQLRIGKVVVAGMPLKGCTDTAFGDERFLTTEDWDKILRQFKILRKQVYDEGVRVVYSIGRKG
ncbi:MAG: radical SAM protein [Desulfobacteraceae bacterium]|nr:radical SAM protein [Desulfobacteraceae bacterium]